MPGRWKVNMRSECKKRKEPNQMESMANTATVWNGCSSQGCLRCLGQKKVWINCDDMGLGLCVQVCCAEDRIWHPVSKLACDGEGTLRFQGYFVFLYSSRISRYSQLDFILFILVALWKKFLFLQIELSYSTVFFLRKQKYAFFSPFAQ